MRPNLQHCVCECVGACVYDNLRKATILQRLGGCHSASDDAHWQVASGYWIKHMMLQVLSNGREFPSKLLGKYMLWLVHLPSP